jgi:uncharacterized membrane protein (DUF485 family)
MDAQDLKTLVRAQQQIAIRLSAAVFIIYFGFIGLVAFQKEAMATQIVPGLSIGILLGALVIVAAWSTTWFYVSWANAHIDSKVKGRAP